MKEFVYTSLFTVSLLFAFASGEFYGYQNYPDDGHVLSILYHESADATFIGGNFSTIGGEQIIGLARTTGDSWTGVGNFSGVVSSLKWWNESYFIVAGEYEIPDKGYKNIALWNVEERQWYPFGSGTELEGPVYCIEILYKDNSKWLAAGGLYPNYNNIAIYKETGWEPLGEGTNGPVYSIVQYNETWICAGGDYNELFNTGLTISNIAWWNLDTNQWKSVRGFSGKVYSLAVYNKELYCAGEYESVEGQTDSPKYISKYDEPIDEWKWLEQGYSPNAACYSLYPTDDYLYIGGAYSEIGNYSYDHVVKYKDNKYEAAFVGYNYTVLYWEESYPYYAVVNCFYYNKTYLYIGGYFENWYNTNYTRIVYYKEAEVKYYIWPTVDWYHLYNSTSVFDRGVSGTVKTICYYGDKYWIGGSFFSCGDLDDSSYLCLWDWETKQFSKVGNAPNGAVNVFAVNGSRLYLGGRFSLISDEPVDYITYWEDEKFHSLYDTDQLGLDDYVNALAINGSYLYCAGDFQHINQDEITYIARYDANTKTWTGLPNSDSLYSVYCLYFWKNYLYAGGAIYNLGTTQVSHLVRYDGNSWSTISNATRQSGDFAVWDIVAHKENLYIAGDFQTFGGIRTSNIVGWNGTSFFSLGSGVNDRIYKLYSLSDYLICGGEFTASGRVAAKGIAYWYNGSWSHVGTGLDGTVYAIAHSKDAIVCGGYFENSGATSKQFYNTAYYRLYDYPYYNESDPTTLPPTQPQPPTEQPTEEPSTEEPTQPTEFPPTSEEPTQAETTAPATTQPTTYRR